MNTLTLPRYTRYLLVIAATAGCVAACGPIHGGVNATEGASGTPSPLSFKNPLIPNGLADWGITIEAPQATDSPTLSEQAATHIATRESAEMDWGPPVQVVLVKATTSAVNRGNPRPQITTLLWVIDVTVPGGVPNALHREHIDLYQMIVIDAMTGDIVLKASGG